MATAVVVLEFPLSDHWLRAYGYDSRWNTLAAIWGSIDPSKRFRPRPRFSAVDAVTIHVNQAGGLGASNLT
ncbi:MAG TPA: hypothetical protein VH639_23560 [Bryobacteraceae bacterium]|jgi:hypothetical protein